MKTPGLRVDVSGGAAWIVAGIVSISPLPSVELEDMGGYIYSDPRIRGRGQALEEPTFRWPYPGQQLTKCTAGCSRSHERITPNMGIRIGRDAGPAHLSV